MGWERCPVCFGRGTVPLGFYEGETVAPSTSAVLMTVRCRSCSGSGVLLNPSEPTPAVTPHQIKYPHGSSGKSYAEQPTIDRSKFLNTSGEGDEG